MAYMSILKKTESQLRLLREPTFLSKAVFLGFLVGVTGVILFGSESYLFKALIAFGAIFLSGFMVDNYEVCDINKETSEVRLTRMHMCQYFLGQFLSPYPYVTCKVGDVANVVVEDQDVGESKKSYRVVMHLKSGIPMGVTEVFTNDAISEHESVVRTIVSFLGMNHSTKAEDDLEYEGDGSSSDDDVEDDDFEQISKADIERLEEEEQDTEAGATAAGACGDSIVNSDTKPEEPINAEEKQPKNGSDIEGNRNTAVN